jgi:lambda family phage portal protein
MGLGDWIDGAIAPVAPGWAAQRMSARARLEASRTARDGIRAYDAAGQDRRTSGWRREQQSADGENLRARRLLAGAGYDLFQNNKYAAAGVRQQVATIWGDGIGVQITHPVKRVREKAQSAWDRWAESKVDDLGDWYGHGKVDVVEMIVGGEGLTIWQPDDGGPFASLVGAEGAQLDQSKNFRLTDGGKIVQGVQFNRAGQRTGYWLFEEHPNDPLGSGRPAQFVTAQYVDHMFERLRHGQNRGVSWLGAVAMTLRDIGDIEDAKRLQEKVQACLALIVLPGEGNEQSSLKIGEQAPGRGDKPGRALEETIRPGSIVRLASGESATVINPTPSGSTVDFLRQQLAGVSASMVPYHLMTGDVSQANYSGLRAAMNGSYGLVDDWQQNTVIPQKVKPAVLRRMRRLVLETGDSRFLQVGMNFALPVRRLVDPVKDLMGELMEVRAGWKLTTKAMAERGLNGEDHLREIARINGLLDELKLALDSDPRKLTDSGVLQAAAPYLFTPPNQGN